MAFIHTPTRTSVADDFAKSMMRPRYDHATCLFDIQDTSRTLHKGKVQVT